METNLLQGDCLELLAQIPDNSVDLIVTDPPYQIDNTKAGGKSALAKSIQSMNNELEAANICDGFNKSVLDEKYKCVYLVQCKADSNVPKVFCGGIRMCL